MTLRNKIEDDLSIVEVDNMVDYYDTTEQVVNQEDLKTSGRTDYTQKIKSYIGQEVKEKKSSGTELNAIQLYLHTINEFAKNNTITPAVAHQSMLHLVKLMRNQDTKSLENLNTIL